jgi:NAD(P)-dependent dehydrogenase (short-subunit alcohol dehydrogenase family)
MVTAAGLATVNHLPVLLLPGDSYTTRRQGPVLQQLEHPLGPDISVNDAFRPIAKFFDRITRPEQLLYSLPNAFRVLANPAETGAVVLALPQDVQSHAFDFPKEFFEDRVWKIRRAIPDREDIGQVAKMIKESKKPLIIAGGGINSSPKQYSSYTLSKVSLTKSMELLSSEEPGIKFISLGTGWIDTPIHNQTLNAGASAGSALAETLRRYESKEFVDINKIMEFIKWAESESSDVITGRNFSLQNDNWSSVALREKLLADNDFYKLRRYGNDEKI